MASKQSQLEKHKPTGNLPESGIDRNYDGHGRDQDQIRKDMARTRAGIDHTLDDLERWTRCGMMSPAARRSAPYAETPGPSP
jgi:hypothetical protein